MERNIRLTIQYDGTNYHGWQYQPGAVTIQEVIEVTIGRITSQTVHLIGAGRTDAGVHARAQIANFRTTSNISPEKLKRAANSLLPRDIKIRKVEEVPWEFHSRKMAKSKIYRYFILNRQEPSPWFYRYSWHIPYFLDFDLMVLASKFFVGEKDFSAFRASDGGTVNNVRIVEGFHLDRLGDLLVFSVKANGFLKNMVRSMVGSLVEVGRKRWHCEKIKEIIEEKKRSYVGPTAPPQGLFLWKVVY